MKIIKESLTNMDWKFRGAPIPQGIQQSGKNPNDDFIYSMYKNQLKIKKQIDSDKFLIHTNWGPDIIIQIIGYDKENS